MLRNATVILLFSSILLPSIVLGSSGDRDPEFQSCVSHCEQRTCLPPNEPTILPWALRLTRWTCVDDCRYTCMHAITDRAISARDYVHQYYGKWPFWRLAGMQEPASVLFSVLNLWAHIRGLRTANRVIYKDHPMRTYYLYWGFVNINAWIWSAVFHTRDTPLTEKLDYFSAGLAILYSLFYTVVRLFHLYSPSPRLGISHPSASRPFLLFLWSTLCLVLYVLHVSYLTLLPRFDYTYNMAASVAIGILHNLLWITYSLPSSPIRPFPVRPKTYFPRHAQNAAVFAALTTAATSLELFDFPPWWRVIDAHALWHLSTIPLVSFWWIFLVDDALDEGWMVEKK